MNACGAVGWQKAGLGPSMKPNIRSGFRDPTERETKDHLNEGRELVIQYRRKENYAAVRAELLFQQAHFVPCCRTPARKRSSSFSSQGPFLIRGSSVLTHRFLQSLLLRWGILVATWFQLMGLWLANYPRVHVSNIGAMET